LITLFTPFLGTTPTEKQNYLLEDINNYAFLNNNDVAMPNVDDAHEFLETLKSMKIMGFVDEEVTGIFDRI
jgi:myosin heavy subunit